MSDIEVKDYGIFSNGVSTTKTYNEKVSNVGEVVNQVKNTLTDSGVLMGPFQEECINEINKLTPDITSIQSNFSSMGTLLIDSSSNYKAGDTAASNRVLSTTSQKSTGTTPVSSVTIPDSVKQAGYTVTCYGEGGWHLSGKETPTKIASGTKQESVHEAWLSDGARYKNGIAVLNVNGTDHYLIATAKSLGTVGDNIDVNFENGQTIPCIIADAKSTNDSNYTTYGHGRSDGSVNILEFEVDRNVYNSTGNPKTSTWGLEWDSSSDVSTVDNYGTIL